MTDSTPPATPSHPVADSWAWDQYWRDGRLASCGGAGGANYQQTITGAWKLYFEKLAPDSRILDACTGNGAIARLAAESAASRGVRFAIEAFDSAMIAPGRIPPNISGMITFHGRVSAERLPYPSRSFDCVVGQYAVEYTQMDLSLPEMARVSKPAACIRFLVHAADGIVAQSARHQLADIERFRRTWDIFSAARRIAELRDAGAEQTRCRQAQAEYHAGVEALRKASVHAVEPVMYHNICNVLTHALSQQHRVGTKPVLDKIAEAVATLDAHAFRLEAMSKAALDERQTQGLVNLAASVWGHPFRYAPLAKSDGAHLGWLVETAGAGERSGVS